MLRPFLTTLSRYRIPLMAVVAVLMMGGVPMKAQERGLPLRESFSVRDYAEHNQTWGAVQDAAGVIYVGNKGLVLAYDGQAWQSIPTGGLFIRGLAVDGEDRIWIGGVDELGYLEPDGRGGRQYVSLAAQLPENDGDVTRIYQIQTLSHGVYFCDSDRILRWHDGEFTIIADGKSFIWPAGGELIAHSPGQPIRSFDGTRWQTLLAEGEILDDWILFGASRADGSQLLFSQRHGMHQLADGVSLPWPAAINASLREHLVQGGLQLRDGNIAVHTRRAGIMLLDPDGDLLHYLDAENGGVPVSYTLGFGQDRTGDIWILQNSGMSRVTWPSPVTVFDRRSGLGTSTVKAIARHQGQLYVATNDGLRALTTQDPGTLPPTAAHFESIEGLGDSIWALASAGDELLIGERSGLWVMNHSGHAQRTAITDNFVMALAVPRNNSQIAWIGAEDTLMLIRRTSSGWKLAHTFDTISGEVRAIAEDRDGAIWAAVSSRGFYRIIPGGDDYATWNVERFAGGHGLASQPITGLPALANRGDKTVFLDSNHVFHFDPTANQFRKTPLGENPTRTPGTTLRSLATGLGTGLWARTFRDDPDAGPWKGRVFWHISAKGTWRALPFAVANTVGENPVFFEEETNGESVLWLGGSEGLVRVELPGAFVKERSFSAKIRRATNHLGETLPLTTIGPPELPFNQQRLTLAFATDRADDPRMRYQTRLQNFDDDWSPLTTVSELSLNHLPSGQHVLEVRARDADGRLSSAAQFYFVVLPAWWQTWLFRSIALLLLAGLITLGVRWRLHTVTRRNTELETLVDQRTRDLQQNEAQLIEARDSADTANRAKSVFLASMSHELRTPLNAILGYSQLLRHDPSVPAEPSRQLATIQHSGEHLLQMINEVLDLAKIEAGRVELNLQPMSLRRLLGHLQEVFALRAGEKQLAFALHQETPLPDNIVGDESRLRQVLYNLLGNAVKFTREGKIDLSVSIHQNCIRFSVTDTGIGISPGEQAGIFSLFHQAAGPVLSAQGAGLGLAISQRLVGLMQGRIGVESEPGQGSLFHFSIPLRVTSTPTSIAASPQVPVGYNGRRRTVLIVDDESVNRDLLRALLGPMGFTLTEADDGDLAVRCFAATSFDLVLMDLRLGQVDGLTATQRIRKLPGGRAARIIAVSASVFPEDRAQAIEAGCDEFVAKPIDTVQFCQVIGRYLEIDWQWPEVAEPPPLTASSSLPPPEGPLPPEIDLKQLYDLADMGDVVSMRTKVSALQVTHPAAAASLNGLAALVADARLTELRRWLEVALNRPPLNTP